MNTNMLQRISHLNSKRSIGYKYEVLPGTPGPLPGHRCSHLCAFWIYGQKDVEGKERAITITAGEIGWLTDTWKKRWNRPPTDKVRQGLINQYLREMILYREAVAMGLDRDDTVIRRQSQRQDLQGAS